MGNSQDLTQVDRGARVIDFYPRTMDQARAEFPCLFQWVLERVKPERDQNPRSVRRDNWWRFAEPNPSLRAAILVLDRMIAVPRTAKWFSFQFISTETIPDTAVVAIAVSDPFILGVLSSRVHSIWAIAAGGTLEDRPRYQHKQTFNPFPFPDPDEPLKARIRQMAEDLDAHRKARQALHPGLTMTGMYNVLEQLRRGEPLGPKEKLIHEQGLVSVLRQLHDELDAAVLAAYGWEDLIPQLLPFSFPRSSVGMPSWPLQRPEVACDAGASGLAPTLERGSQGIAATGGLPEALMEEAASRRTGAPTGEPGLEETILQRLVALNAERAAEERRGLVRWLRRDFQNPGGTTGGAGVTPASGPEARPPGGRDAPAPWPKTLPEQIQALRAALSALQGPASPGDLAQGFTRAPRAKVAELLETLAGLGLVRRLDDGRYLPG